MSDVRSKVDMSPEAIAARIAEVAALNRLCESLAHATPSPAASSPAGQPPAPPAPKLGR